jgi:hypothetical protein
MPGPEDVTNMHVPIFFDYSPEVVDIVLLENHGFVFLPLENGARV